LRRGGRRIRPRRAPRAHAVLAVGAWVARNAGFSTQHARRGVPEGAGQAVEGTVVGGVGTDGARGALVEQARLVVVGSVSACFARVGQVIQATFIEGGSIAVHVLHVYRCAIIPRLDLGGPELQTLVDGICCRGDIETVARKHGIVVSENYRDIGDREPIADNVKTGIEHSDRVAACDSLGGSKIGHGKSGIGIA